MNIREAIITYQSQGYKYADAESKVSQDIIFQKLETVDIKII